MLRVSKEPRFQLGPRAWGLTTRMPLVIPASEWLALLRESWPGHPPVEITWPAWIAARHCWELRLDHPDGRRARLEVTPAGEARLRLEGGARAINCRASAQRLRTRRETIAAAFQKASRWLSRVIAYLS